MKNINTILVAAIIIFNVVSMLPPTNFVLSAEDTFIPYGNFGNLLFEDSPPNMSQWSANGTAVTYTNNTDMAHIGQGALHIDGTSPISVWGGPAAGNPVPVAGDTISGYFWMKILTAPTTATLPDVRMTGYTNSVETIYCHTKAVDMSTLPLNTWIKMDLISAGNTFNTTDAVGFNIISSGGINCVIDDVTIGKVTGTAMPTPTQDDRVSKGIAPPMQEYSGSTLNGNFETASASNFQYSWGQWVPNQGAVAGSPNMINLIADAGTTEPHNAASGKNMAEIVRGGVAWNLGSLSASSGDALPHIGDKVCGSYWIYIPNDIDLSLGVPNVTCVYQQAGGDVTISSSQSFPTSSLVKGKWNQIPISPLSGGIISASATGFAIIINAPQLNSTANPLYAAKFYIDDIRVGKLKQGLFISTSTGLCDYNGNSITGLSENDTDLFANVAVQNTNSDIPVNASVVLALYQDKKLVGITTKEITIPARGSTGLQSAICNIGGVALNGLDKSKIVAKLFLWDSTKGLYPYTTSYRLIQPIKKMDATNSNIKYFGRWSGDSSSKTSNWVRPYLKTNFTGSTLKINLRKAANLDVTIDGKETFYASVTGLVDLAADLSSGSHEVRIATTNWQEQIQYDGLYVDEDSVLSAPALKSKTIEFVGDSITAWDNGYSWKVPEQIGTESTRICYPGISLLDGFGYTGLAGTKGMDSAFLKIGMPGLPATIDTEDWDFSASPYTPDVVVINLGTNDGAQITAVPSFLSNFQTTYADFIKKVRAKYPNAQIFVLRAFSIHYDNVNTAIYNAAQAAMVGDSKVHYIDTINWGVEIGTDGIHPTDAGHVTITNNLVSILTPYLH